MNLIRCQNGHTKIFLALSNNLTLIYILKTNFLPFVKSQFLILFLIALLGVYSVGAQSTDSTRATLSSKNSAAKAFYWLEFSSGLGTIISSSISLNAEVGPLRLGLEFRESSFGEFDIFDEPDEILQAINLKVGKLYKGKNYLLDLHGGLGVGSYGVPVNVQSNFLSYSYDLQTRPSMSWVVGSQAAINLKVFLLGLQVGVTGNTINAGFYAGLTLGFGKFF